jgi:hypothetical protein
MKSLPQDKVTKKMPRKGKGAKSGHREKVARRQQRAMSLRLAGASYAQIASVCRVSKQQSFRDVLASLHESLELRNSDANFYRETELLRLDAMLVALWPKVQKADVEAVHAALRISQRRSALLGLDALQASRLELSGGVLHIQPAPNPLEKLTDTQLLERLAQLQLLLTPAAPMLPPPPEAETPETRYAKVLEARRAGNGGSLST